MPDPASTRSMFAALTACPGCGRSSVCRSSRNTWSVPSSPSTLIAAVSVGDVAQVLEVGDRHDEHAEHAVGPVDEGQALLLPQLDGLDAGRGQQLGHGALDAVGTDGPALAHEHEGAVRERGEVAAAAQRAELVDDRRDLGVEQGGHGLRDHGAGSRAAAGQRLQPQQHEGADDLALDGRPHPGGVRADERALELDAALDRDVPVGQRAEPGGDPVDRRGRAGQGVDLGAAGRHGGDRRIGQLDAGIRRAPRRSRRRASCPPWRGRRCRSWGDPRGEGRRPDAIDEIDAGAVGQVDVARGVRGSRGRRVRPARSARRRRAAGPLPRRRSPTTRPRRGSCASPGRPRRCRTACSS